MSDPPSPSDDGPGEDRAEIRTFLIADVRGYTLFTVERGDEAAAKLAAKFAALAREAVEGRGGTVLELRGDEALCVFASARQALRAAVELQARFLEETLAEPAFPLGVGIGVDAGEAVAVEGGYRGGALNLAARLCGQARPGEILASREATHLARRIDGIEYRERGALHLKGMPAPVRAVRVVSASDDVAARFQALTADQRRRTPGGLRGRLPQPFGRRGGVIAIAGVVVGAFVVTAMLTLGRASGPPRPRPSAAAGATVGSAVHAFDSSGHAVRVLALPAGTGPAVFDGSLWVASLARNVLTRIVPRSGRVLGAAKVGLSPSGIAHGDPGDGRDSVWVANQFDGSITRVDPMTGQVAGRIAVGIGIGALSVGDGSVWAADVTGLTLYRVDPMRGSATAIHVRGFPSTCSFCVRQWSLRGVAVAPSGVWVSVAGVSQGAPKFAGIWEGGVARIDPATGKQTFAVRFFAVGAGGTVGPMPVLVDGNDVWVASYTNDSVYDLDTETKRIKARVPVGDGPLYMTLDGSGSLWVATISSEQLWQITTATAQVAKTIELHARPIGIAAGDDRIWIATT